MGRKVRSSFETGFRRNENGIVGDTNSRRRVMEIFLVEGLLLVKLVYIPWVIDSGCIVRVW